MDKRLRTLELRWKSTGSLGALKAWVRALEQANSDEVDDVRSLILKGMVKALKEENEDRATSDDGDESNELLDTDADYMQAAKRLAAKIERLNRFTLNGMYKVAEDYQGASKKSYWKTPRPEDFGYYLVYQSFGHGIAWSDNHPDPKFKYPYSSIYEV